MNESVIILTLKMVAPFAKEKHKKRFNVARFRLFQIGTLKEDVIHKQESNSIDGFAIMQ